MYSENNRVEAEEVIKIRRSTGLKGQKKDWLTEYEYLYGENSGGLYYNKESYANKNKRA